MSVNFLSIGIYIFNWLFLKLIFLAESWHINCHIANECNDALTKIKYETQGHAD